MLCEGEMFDTVEVDAILDGESPVSQAQKTALASSPAAFEQQIFRTFQCAFFRQEWRLKGSEDGHKQTSAGY